MEDASGSKVDPASLRSRTTKSIERNAYGSTWPPLTASNSLPSGNQANACVKQEGGTVGANSGSSSGENNRVHLRSVAPISRRVTNSMFTTSSQILIKYALFLMMIASGLISAGNALPVSSPSSDRSLIPESHQECLEYRWQSDANGNELNCPAGFRRLLEADSNCSTQVLPWDSGCCACEDGSILPGINHCGTCISNKTTGPSPTVEPPDATTVFPSFTKTPSDVRAKVGTTASLECFASGHPMPEISWEKVGGRQFPATLDSHRFSIVEIQLNDTGIYTCTASSQAGTISSNATLTVLQDPYITEPLADQEAHVGGTAILECQVGGSPQPVIHWSKDGQPLIPSVRHKLPVEDGKSFLIIRKVTLEDQGEYVCNASNSEGFVEDRGMLTVSTAQPSNWKPLLVAAIIFSVTAGLFLICTMFVVIRKWSSIKKDRAATDPAVMNPSALQMNPLISSSGEDPVDP